MPESPITSPEATDTADSETKPLDIPGEFDELREFMSRSIGTRAGIAKARIRDAAQRLREKRA
jgi:hypothetical protein